MAEAQNFSKTKSGQETESEVIKETGVLVYHTPTSARFAIKAKIQRGSGKISVNGVSIVDLMEKGRIRKIEELLRVMSRERLKAFDIDLDVGEALSNEAFSPPVLSYALAEALTNLLGRL